MECETRPLASLASVGRWAGGLPSFPLPCFSVGGGSADGFDTPFRPSTPVLALAAFKVRGDALVHDAVADQKAVSVSGRCRRSGDHAQIMLGRRGGVKSDERHAGWQVSGRTRHPAAAERTENP